MARPKKVTVVDASVAIKWFNLEPHAEKALMMLDDYRNDRIDIIAPYLLVYEVANALRYNHDFGELDVREALAFLEDLQLGLKLMDRADIERCLSTAFSYGLTVYDAVYISLADKEGCELYTADEKSLSKMSSSSKLHHIAEYGS